MKDIQRRLDALDRDIAKRKKELKAIERAQEIRTIEPKVEKRTQELYFVKCGNCGETLVISESCLHITIKRWRFCPYCGVGLEGLCE